MAEILLLAIQTTRAMGLVVDFICYFFVMLVFILLTVLPPLRSPAKTGKTMDP